MIVSKTSKRLHIIRVLRKGDVNAADLLVIYVALVRSVLEYCCAWFGITPFSPTCLVNRAGLNASFKDNISSILIPGSLKTC